MPNKGDAVNGAFKAQGIQLAAKLSYPIMDDLDVYTRLGGMVWRADSTQHVVGTNISRNDHDTGVSPLAAVGVEYALNKNWATRRTTSGLTTSVTLVPLAPVLTTPC